MKAFRTTTERGYNDGFQMTFGNGCTISVQFGIHTYSDAGETTAEIGAWNSNGDWMCWNGDNWSVLTDDHSDIMSHQSPDNVAVMISELIKIY
jgi:hypothetical protein